MNFYQIISMRILKILILCFLLNGCTDRNVITTSEEIRIANYSNQSVELHFYSGLPIFMGLDTTIYLSKAEDKLLFSTGEVTGGPILISFQNIIPADTCYMVFNDSLFLKFDLYSNTDERNILDLHTYQIDKKESKHMKNFKYTYTITEQDFLDAEPL